MSNPDSPINDIFLAARCIENPTARAEYLDMACGGNTELRSQIERMLAAAVERATSTNKPPGTERESPAHFESPPENPVTASLHDISGGPGPVIGPYQLLQQLGEGGMGTVYVAEQQEPVRRKVALKIIKPGMDSKQVVARFEAERQALAMMDHQNIAKVFDAGTTKQHRPYFVMELVRGVPITTYCDKKKLSLIERLRLFIPVCQAIQHAHLKGIIHRDIKPSNVLVCDYDGAPVPKVIDFGVAKAVQQRLTEQSMFTEFGQVIGTLEYMSPEQAGTSQLDIDTRSDIYSLGVLLYELLTGSTPLSSRQLRAAGLDEMLRLIREKEAEKPSTRLSGSGDALPSLASCRRTEPKKLSTLIRGDLDWIVMKALDKDRSRRYDTASGLARDIERHLDDEPIEARPPSALYKIRKLARKHRAAIAGLVAFVAVLCLASAISTWHAIRATRAETQADLARTDAVDQAAEARREKENAEHATATAARALFDMQTSFGLAACDRGNAAEGALWFANAAFITDDLELQRDSRVRTFAFQQQATPPLNVFWHDGEELKDLAFDPISGQFLATLTYQGRCTLWDLREDDSSCLAGFAECMAFSPNKDEFAAGFRDGSVRVLSLGGWQLLHHIDCAAPVTAVAFAPNGEQLAVGADSVQIWDFEKQTFVTPALEHPKPLRSLTFADSGKLLATDCEDNVVRLYDLAKDNPTEQSNVRRLPHFARWQDRVRPCRPKFVNQDQGILTLQNSTLVACWKTEDGKLEEHIRVGGYGTNAWQTSPDGRYLIASGIGKEGLTIWDLREHQRVVTRHLSGNANSVAFSPDGTTFVTGTIRGDVQCWNTADGSPLGLVFRQASAVNAVEFAPHGRCFAIGHLDGSVRVCRAADPSGFVRRLDLPGHRTSLAISANGRYLLPTGSSWFFGNLRKTQVWDIASCRPVGAMIEPGGLLTHAAFSSDAKRVATVSIPDSLRTWDWQTGEEIGERVALPGEPRGVAFHPHDGYVVVLCDGGAILAVAEGKTLWQTQHSEGLTARIRTRSDQHNYDVGGDEKFAPLLNPNYYVQFTLDSKWVITSGLNNQVNVLDAASGKQRYAPLLHTDYVRNVALSDDGSLLGTVTADGFAQVWDIETGRPLCQPLAHPLVLNSACFSSDNRLLMTTGRDGLVRVWDWSHGRLDCPPLHHGHAVMQAVFLADGKWIMSTGEDLTVRFWSRKTGHPLAPAVGIGGVGQQLIVNQGEDTVFVSGTASTVDVIPLASVLDPGQVEDQHVETWAEFVSGQRVQDAGIVQLTTEEVLERSRTLRRSYPERFPRQLR